MAGLGLLQPDQKLTSSRHKYLLDIGDVIEYEHELQISNVVEGAAEALQLANTNLSIIFGGEVGECEDRECEGESED